MQVQKTNWMILSFHSLDFVGFAGFEADHVVARKFRISVSDEFCSHILN